MRTIKEKIIEENCPEVKVACDCPRGGTYDDGRVCEKCGGSEWVIPENVSKSFDLYATELLKKRLGKRLKYCQEQNGLPYCKNCGLCEEDLMVKSNAEKEGIKI